MIDDGSDVQSPRLIGHERSLVCFLYLLIKETHLEVDVFALGGILREL
jgi:hypothetical protein